MHIEIETKLIVIRLSEITSSVAVRQSAHRIPDWKLSGTEYPIRSVAEIDKDCDCERLETKKKYSRKILLIKGNCAEKSLRHLKCGEKTFKEISRKTILSS